MMYSHARPLVFLFFSCLTFFSCSNSTDQLTSQQIEEVNVSQNEQVYGDKVKTLKGFKSYKMNSDLSLYPHFIKSNEQNYKPDEVYFDPNSDDKIGDIEIESLAFIFYKNKLKDIVYWTDIENSRDLVYSYLEKYGEGHISDINTLLPVTIQNDSVSLHLEEDGASVRVTYRSKSLEEVKRIDVLQDRINAL